MRYALRQAQGTPDRRSAGPPAILRAMKAVKGTHLLVGEYCGVGATWVQVVRVFSLSGIVVIQLEDVEQVVIPESL